MCCCSDGAGRSGVYLAIDANIELSEEDGVFDVYGYLKKMRQQRRGLVESLVSQCFQERPSQPPTPSPIHTRQTHGMDVRCDGCTSHEGCESRIG